MNKNLQELTINGKSFPFANIRKQNGLKRKITELCLNAPTPDDDCMLSDFLMALQYILDEYAQSLPVTGTEGKTLSQCKDEVARKIYQCEFQDLFLMGQDKMSDILKVIDEANALFYANQHTQRGTERIPVSERLPEDHSNILFITSKDSYRKGIFMSVDGFNRKNMFYGELGYFNIDQVTPWMPLPSPPKEK